MGNGVRQGLNYSEFSKLLVLEPPLIEQERVSAFLDEKCAQIDDLINVFNNQIKGLSEYKKSIIYETVTKGLSKKAKTKSSNLNWIEQIPDDWGVDRIKYRFNNSKGLPITKDDLIDSGLPVISYGQIHSKLNSGVDISDDLLRFVDDRFRSLYPNCEIKKYDFVFADTSEDYDGCGNCVYKRDDRITYAGYHSIILHSKYQNDNRYFAYLFKTDCWRKQLRENASGVKVYSISQKSLLNASIIVPPYEEQIKISDYLDDKCTSIDNCIISKNRMIDLLKEYKKTMIFEYVTGKKEVPSHL